MEFFERIFWYGFFGEDFFGRNCLGGIFCEDFFGNFFGGIFGEKFYVRIFWEEFLEEIFGRNLLFTLLRSAKLFEMEYESNLKELIFLSRFWGNARKEGQEFRSLEVRSKLIALKK